MKNSFGKFLTVLGCGFILTGNAWAQNPAISQFPYMADFGTTGTPGADNPHWQFKAFDADENPITASQWSFSEISEEKQAICFTQNDGTGEDIPAAFTPVFHFEKEGSTSYVVKVTYSVPSGLVPSRQLIVRLHSTDNTGEPYYIYSSNGVEYKKENPMKDSEGKIRCVMLRNHNGVPGVGVSEYTYHITSDLIPESGDYRVSFIIARPSTKNIKSGQKLYITALDVQKYVGSDLAAGQIISPYTDPQAGTQAFSAFIINQGGGNVDQLTACYQVDGSAPVRETFSNVGIAPNKVCRITFKSLPDLQAGDHTLRFWIDNADDLDRSNDTATCLVRSGSPAVATQPATFRFTEEKPYEWTMHSDSFYAEPAWRFRKDDGKNRPYISTKKPNNVRNNDYLLSPVFNFEKDRMYRIEFTYKAVLASNEIMGDKSMALYMCKNAGRDALVSKELVWKQDRFEYTGNRRMVVYYRAQETAARTLAFHAYGPASDGGLQLQEIAVSQAEENGLDYFFDFDGSSSEEPEYLVEKNLDFVDYDGNMSNAGTPGNWALYGANSGYNSQYSVRSIGLCGTPSSGTTKKTDDWIVFKPFYLEADKNYYLNFRARMSSNNNGSLEYYVTDNGPRYDLAYDAQDCVKGRKTGLGNSYDTVRRVFTVRENGYYLLAIRNVTVVPQQDDEESVANYTVYVDNVSLGAKERNSVQAMYATVPYEARLGQTVSLRMTVRNFSLAEVSADKIKYCYQIDNGEVCREQPASTLASQVNYTYSFTQRAVFKDESDQTVRFWVEMEGSSEKPDTVSVHIAKIKAKDLPFVERFAEKSMDEWQSYPASRRQWQMQFGTETAHSGEWAAKCAPGSSAVSDFLVSPLLRVEKNKTYRVSFFSKRGGNNVGSRDSLSLFYAYNRYDQTGFLRQLTVFSQPVSSEYEFYQAYVRFPDSGVVFLGLEAKLAGNTDPLYIDDFVLVDSLRTTITDYVVSDLLVSGNMSECDTMAIGKLSFKITAGGFSMPETVKAYIRYDDMPVQDVSFHKEMMDGEETELSFAMPMFSGGEHRVKAWIALPEEVNRTDDTVSASFNVHSPQAMPFLDGNIRVVGSARMSSCFTIDSTGTYILRYLYDATQAEGASMELNLLTYGGNRIVNAREVDALSKVSGKQVVEKEIEIAALGVYAFGLECTGLPVGGVFCIDSLCLEKKTASGTGDDTTAVGTFTADEFRMQPNPATDFLEITVPVQAQHLDIFDMQGRVCRHLALRQGQTYRVGLQGLRPGVYMVRVWGGHKAATLKLIKR